MWRHDCFAVARDQKGEKHLNDGNHYSAYGFAYQPTTTASGHPLNSAYRRPELIGYQPYCFDLKWYGW